MIMKIKILYVLGVISSLVACIPSNNVRNVEPLDEGIGFQIVLGVLGEDAEIIDFDSSHGGDRIEAETKNGRILVLWKSSGGDVFRGTLANRFNQNPTRKRVSVRKYNISCLKGLKPTKGCWRRVSATNDLTSGSLIHLIASIQLSLDFCNFSFV
jgi:hypothetical protein